MIRKVFWALVLDGFALCLLWSLGARGWVLLTAFVWSELAWLRGRSFEQRWGKR